MRSRRALVATSVMALVGITCAGRQPAPATTAAAPSGRTSDFALRDVQGRTVHLSDHLGKEVILLAFWATWCVPCAAELPHLERLFEAHRGEGLLVLGIAMDGPESVAGVGPFVRRNGLTFPILLDEETRVVGTYNPKRAAPFSVLIGRDGAVAKTQEGYTAGDERAIETDVQQLLAAGVR